MDLDQEINMRANYWPNKILEELTIRKQYKRNEISVAYNVSPTVLNKIKREEINEDNMIKENK